MKTSQQYDHVANICRDIFVKKMTDYGAAWRILRPSSLTDQLFIKARRIRTIETKGESRVAEDARGEYIGIVNYAAIALIQLELGVADHTDMPAQQATDLYSKYIHQAKTLMEAKNHDYDEAWRLMRLSSLTDLILTKIYRTKQIEDNSGKTLISEGIDANYYDMINYAMFALIKLEFPE